MELELPWLSMMLGGFAGLFAGLIGYELLRRDKPWNASRVITIALGTVIFFALWGAARA